MTRPRHKPSPKQPTPEDLLAELLRFVEVKFYPGDPIGFIKDKPRLLDWVILCFAEWLNSRGVTIPPTRYLEIMRDHVLMEALRHGNTGSITYRPAWLRKVIQSHLAVHGDEYYDEAKSMRNLTENALAVAGRFVQPLPDPIRELATLKRLCQAARQSKQRGSGVNDQLNLL